MATKRLIDATPLIDGCKECSAIEWNRNVYTTWAEAEEDFMERLLDAPTVDAVEVVRCKDCKDCVAGYCAAEIDGVVRLRAVKPDDFCAWGERKDNG